MILDVTTEPKPAPPEDPTMPKMFSVGNIDAKDVKKFESAFEFEDEFKHLIVLFGDAVGEFDFVPVYVVARDSYPQVTDQDLIRSAGYLEGFSAAQESL